MTMTGRVGWLWLILVGVSVGRSHAQETPPVGHIPGGPDLLAGNLCDLSDTTTLVGEITVSEHATLFEGFGSSAASKDYFIAGMTPTGVRRSLLKFGLEDAGFPDDSQILCAEIRLSLNFYLSSLVSDPAEITLHEVTQPWSNNADSSFEGLNGLNGSPAVTGDVTWEYKSFPVERWANEGGDFGGESVSRQQETAEDGFEHEWFGNTKRLHALVDQWISDSSTNHGVLIKSGELPTDPIAYNVYHVGEGDTSLAPKLIVVYTAPSLGYPHKVAHDPNVPSQFPTFALDDDDYLIPTDPPTVFDDMMLGIPTDSPSTSPVSSTNNGPTGKAVSSSGSGDSGDGSSDSEDGMPFGFTRDSNSNTEYTAIAISVTGIAVAAIVASVFGLIPHSAERRLPGDNNVPPESRTPTELV